MTSRKTTRYKLDASKTLPYFLDHIKCGKTLSKRVCEKVDFSKGYFSTILPCNTDLNKLFDFSCGGIVPSVPCGKEGYRIKDRPEKFYPNKIITMDHECGAFITDFLSKSYENWAVIENYMLDPDSPYVKIGNAKMIPFNSDVYYFLNKNNSTKEIYETLRKSTQVWHFLAVLTRLKEAVSAVLTDAVINQICENAEFIIAGAYDGEGYIFWEREGTEFQNNT